MNYFEFFDLPVSFFLDEEDLKRHFYQNSKRFHPDFFTLDSPEKQAEILELSTLNNQAYRTLSDFDKRMEYILQLHGIFAEEGKNQIPQDFLAEMMEVNEAIMELEFDFDPVVYQNALQSVQNLEIELFAGLRPTLENYRYETSTTEELTAVRDYFFKKRYLLRFFENLDRFASALKKAAWNWKSRN